MFGVGIGLSATVLAVLAWGPVGRGLWRLADGLGWAGSAAAWAAVVVVAVDLVRCSLELTGDLDAFVLAHVELARKNLADLAPPRLVYLLLFSHPTPSERLALGRAWAAGS